MIEPIEENNKRILAEKQLETKSIGENDNMYIFSVRHIHVYPYGLRICISVCM